MIDTIVLRFHGILDTKNSTLEQVQASNNQNTLFAVDEHHQLYKKMMKVRGKSFSMVKTVKKQITSTSIENESDFLLMQSGMKAKGYGRIKEVMQFIDGDQMRETNLRVTGKFNNPSSTAAVVYSINENGGFIDFNLSIPKYLYSHSLAEFIPQYLSPRYFNTPSLDNVNTQRKILYPRLMKFIDKFFSDICNAFEVDVMPNKDYIEIRRIDICYNQYFKSKADALNYLEHQKKIAKIKRTASNNILKVHNTSLEYFTGKGSYFKIYHKGTEYMSSKFGDFKKHMDLNKLYIDNYLKRDEALSNAVVESLKNKDFIYKLFHDKINDKSIYLTPEQRAEANQQSKVIKKVQPFDTVFFKDEMDKVLRYEISLSGDFFRTHYKKKIFRKNCPYYKDLQKNHKYVHGCLNNIQKKKVSKAELRDYKILDDFYSRSISLTLSENQSFKRYLETSNSDYSEIFKTYNLSRFDYRYSILSLKDVGIFSEDFLTYCTQYFFREVKALQPKKLEEFETLSQRIIEYNNNVEIRIKEYNTLNNYKCFNHLGKNIVKGNMRITKATQLLTQKQKHDMKLKPIQTTRILPILQQLEKGESLLTLKEKLCMTDSTYSRLKRDLSVFDVMHNTVDMEPIETEISYRQYYFNTQGLDYQNKFYFKKSHMRYG